MSDTEEDSKDKSKRPLEVSSEGNDEVEEKRSSRKRGKNLKIFRPYFAFQVMHYIRECGPPTSNFGRCVNPIPRADSAHPLLLAPTIFLYW